MKNRLKEKLRSGKTAIGCWEGLNSPAVTEVLAGAGYDALLIDYEHGEGSVGDLVHHLRAAEGSETTVIVRVARQPARNKTCIGLRRSGNHGAGRRDRGPSPAHR